MKKNIYEDRPWLSAYPDDIPHRIDIPLKSVSKAFDEAVERFGMEKTSIIFYGRRISYGELKDHIDRFANALYNLGVRKGDRIVLYLVNCPQVVIAFMAALKLGAIVSPMNPSYVVPEIRHRLEDSGAETVICLDLLYDRVEKAGIPVKDIIITSIDDYLPPPNERSGQHVLPAVYNKMTPPSQDILDRKNVNQFRELIERYSPTPPSISVSPKEDVAVLPYTGGTTGMPKGVMITHYYLMSTILQDAAFWPELKAGEEIMPGYMPFFHIMGIGQVILKSLILGFTNVIISNPDLDDLLTGIEEHGLTYFLAIPAILEAFMQNDKMDDINWKRLKAVITGADIMPPETSQRWEERTGIRPSVAWGLTEFTAATTTLRQKSFKHRCIGVPQPNIIVAIVDPESTEFLPVGQVGEMLLSGPTMMKGYWNHPEETREAILDINGRTWLRTGDLASMDKSGYFFFAGRKKYMIKHKGYGLFPPEIESVLLSHPDITEAAVVGVPNPNTGEDVVAIVVSRLINGKHISEKEILQFCKENLAHIKIPRNILFTNELPKTNVGKIDRDKLTEIAANNKYSARS